MAGPGIEVTGVGVTCHDPSAVRPPRPHRLVLAVAALVAGGLRLGDRLGVVSRRRPAGLPRLRRIEAIRNGSRSGGWTIASSRGSVSKGSASTNNSRPSTLRRRTRPAARCTFRRLISTELPEWMPLHFQFDPATGWTSPQVLPPGTVDPTRESVERPRLEQPDRGTSHPAGGFEPPPTDSTHGCCAQGHRSRIAGRLGHRDYPGRKPSQSENDRGRCGIEDDGPRRRRSQSAGSDGQSRIEKRRINGLSAACRTLFATGQSRVDQSGTGA